MMYVCVHLQAADSQLRQYSAYMHGLHVCNLYMHVCEYICMYALTSCRFTASIYVFMYDVCMYVCMHLPAADSQLRQYLAAVGRSSLLHVCMYVCMYV
jgi:hypothetical protein